MSKIDSIFGKGLEDFFSGKTEKFDLILNECGANKKEVVFLLCDTFGFSLEVAEKIVDNAPIVLKESISKTEAESLKEKFESIGTTVEICESAIYSVTLTDLGVQSVKVIKQLSEILNISNENVINKVENLPFIIAESASKLEAEKILCRLNCLGATVNTQKL